VDIYVHYGTDEIDPKYRYGKWKFDIFKPSGLWACDEKQENNWKSWCIGERFEKSDFSKYVKFSLKDDARILTIEKTEDAIPFIIMDTKTTKSYKEKGIMGLSSISGCSLNEIKLKKQFDGMKLVHGENYNELHLNPGLFYAWDVDSIVVWNLDKINVISTSNDPSNEKKKRRIRVCA